MDKILIAIRMLFPPMIQRSIIQFIYIGGNDVAKLNTRIIECCRHSPRSHGAGVVRSPCYNDGVTVGIAEQDGDQSECAPNVVHRAGPLAKCNKERQGPHVLEHGNNRALPDRLADPCEA